MDPRFTLTQTDLDPGFAAFFAESRPDWTKYRAVAWIRGAGPWDKFLSTIPRASSTFSFIAKDGAQHLYSPDQGVDSADFSLFMALLTAAEHAFDGGVEEANYCVILRPTSFLVLQQQAPHFYVPLGSGHEALEDLRRLEEEFPGLFTLAPKPSFTLRQVELDPKWIEALARHKPYWGFHKAVAWAIGHDRWDSLVARVPDSSMQVTFFETDGKIRVEDLTKPINGERRKLFDKVLLCGEAAVDQHGFADKTYCVILRENSFIALRPNGDGIYAPLGNGHEALADIGQLEHEFPGIFQFAS